MALAAFPLHAEGTFEACYTAYTGQKPDAPALCQPFADSGNREAMKLVGDMYYWGWGALKQDYDQAALWYKRSAAKGQAAAKYNLGVMYEQGIGRPVDYSAAAKWYFSAAKDGYANAQFNVANMFAKGAGTRQDDVMAARWYEKAAMQGVPEAQFNIGNRYAKGLGVPLNVVEAYKWFILAERSGDERATQNRQLLQQALDMKDVEKAEQAAAAWHPVKEWQGME